MGLIKQFIIGDSVFGLTRTETIFLALFGASTILTIITIAVAIVVVQLYRKREIHHSYTCTKCQNEIGLCVDQNERNTTRLKGPLQDGRIVTEYESGTFGDTVYISRCHDLDLTGSREYQKRELNTSRCLSPNSNAHTYASIPSSMKTTPEGARKHTLRLLGSGKSLRPHGAPEVSSGDLYENISSQFHVVFTPKTGKKELKFNRRNSVS